MRSTPIGKPTRSPPERRREALAAERLDARSALAFRFFGAVFERTLRASFHAARLLGAPPPELGARKLVVYANHPSWWDAIAYMTIARKLLPGRACYAPIDAAMLRRYGFMRRIGAFGVEQGSVSGAADFLSLCRAAIARDAPLIVAAQGRFSDVRERPLALRPGLAHLVDLDPDICFLPLALEYAFWDEKRPEMLIGFGTPLTSRELAPANAGERLARLEGALTLTLDRLSAAAMTRDPRRFVDWIAGRGGVNPIYDVWRRARAAAHGRKFSPEHGARE